MQWTAGMRILITVTLMALGFIFGVAYDQNAAVLPLTKEVKVERDRNTVLDKALDLCTKNKFKKRDFIWSAVHAK